MRQELKQVLRMEQASLLEMPEDEFSRLVHAIETSPLFQKLYRKEKLIRYQKFPRADLSGLYLKEEIIADKGSLDIDSLLLNKEDIVRQIQKLGREKFKRYFLFPENGLTEEELARECDLPVAEVCRINSLIDDFSVLSEFYQPSTIGTEGICYYKIAAIERDREGFTIGFYSLNAARGKYVITYDKFEELVRKGAFSEAEIKEARQLFKRLELVNSRKDTISRIVQGIVDKQRPYLESGDIRALLPYSQKQLAQSIGVAPSSVSRAIGGKSVATPWGKEVPLKHFFPGPKKFKLELLKQLLEANSELSSDEKIRTRLWEKFGVAISRRSVSYLRKELNIPAYRRKRENRGIK